ncbi:STAS-like domain-containing protein [Achromobacter xylosoxidans]|uniref:STAS-like domain-containing protein n=1 Tax=Alcaligenes xylosoxydans xylosoxydans TaxID=85698 RepID=UPI0005D73FAE|nr:STAS-like domain-containing protein [Achromobacter xylosoxidans]QKQ52310.1 STAS-like domain-containing protein [Achromobacter xylosoxidans]QPR92809.1 STAS-like domain-containing protein [Achromobacter xylosoxidans]UON42487.1 STAS-like domain-containing protein [Achromobacter xylosoxidans]CKH65524.1 Uncharacterised protein [Achromobacter xylosoxidans]
MDIYLKEFSRSPVLGQRHTARPIRDHINAELKAGHHVMINFRGIEVTQSFADELVGALVLEHGPEVISRISFAECSEASKGILVFVIRDRVRQRAIAASQLATTGPFPFSPRPMRHIA